MRVDLLLPPQSNPDPPSSTASELLTMAPRKSTSNCLDANKEDGLNNDSLSSTSKVGRATSTKNRNQERLPACNGNERGKLVVSLNPYCMEYHHPIIHFAQDDFYKMFGYTPADLPMNLEKLYGEGSQRDVIFHLQTALLSRKSELRYMNLYRKDGTPVACHITLVSIIGDSTDGSSPTVIDDPLYNKDERWAVLTIRSASVVGNSKFCGIGLLGTDRVLPEKLQEIGSREAITQRI